MQLVDSNDAVLREKAKAVTRFSNIPLIAKEMLEIMEFYKGVGLAAPQVGLSLRLFVISPSSKAADGFCIVNPEIECFGEKEEAPEGCLSLPEVQRQVPRWQNAKVKGKNEFGHDISFEFGNDKQGKFLARIVQHEFDHLEGKLITDYISYLDYKSISLDNLFSVK